MYRTELDNFPTIILEAMASGLVCLTNNFESFKYFLPPFVISNTEKEMINQLMTTVNNYTNAYSKKCLEHAKQYDEKIITRDLIAFIKKDVG
jgi:glycosyltransferase involved in cell wall biosynthesis